MPTKFLKLQLTEEESSDLKRNSDSVKILEDERPGSDVKYSKEERKLVTNSGRAARGRTGTCSEGWHGARTAHTEQFLCAV